MNTKLQEVEFKDLSEEQKNQYIELHKKGNLKFNFDKKKDQYIGLLQIEQTKPSSKRNYTPKTIPREYHKECTQKVIYNVKRPPKKYIRKSFTTPTNDAFFNKEKMAMITKYQFVFEQVNFFEMNTIPILIHLKKLVKFLEIFYGLFFAQICRKRTYSAIDLSKTIYDYYNNIYQENYNFKRMFLAKWVYSLDKFKMIREVDFFRQILIQRVDHDIVLLFMYLRENFRFQTQNYFLNHDKHQKDPRWISIDKKFAIIILETAFYFNKDFQHDIINKFNTFIGNGEAVSYYDFLFFSLNQYDPVKLEELDLLTFLIAIYDDEESQKPEIYKKPFTKTPHQTSKIIKLQNTLHQEKKNIIYQDNRKISNLIKRQNKVKQQKNIQINEKEDILEIRDEKNEEIQDLQNENIEIKTVSNNNNENTIELKYIEINNNEYNQQILEETSYYMKKRRLSNINNNILQIMEDEVEEMMEEIMAQNKKEINKVKQWKIVKETICEKVLRIFVSIKNKEFLSFENLLRINHQQETILWKRLISDSEFTFNRPKIIDAYVSRFFRMVFEIEELYREIEFLMKNNFYPDQTLQKLLSLEDSIFL